jgi:hydrophobic/amphiphilic exporter-1 (mainly G- bacteria), HAE1 family
MSISSLSIRRPVATAMLFLIVILLGALGFRFLPVDLLPEIEYPQLSVVVDYDNVGPQEIEQIITRQVENALAGVPNVEEVTSNSSEGRSRVTLRFAQGVDINSATNDVRDALDRVRRTLPDEADPPRIWRFNPDDFPIVILGVASDRNMAETTRIISQELLPNFEQIPGVGSIDIWGGVYREVQVDLHRGRLASSNLTGGDVIQALGRENVTLPGGNVKDGYTDLYVRTDGQFQDLEEIRNTVIVSSGGRPIRVRDVADVRHGYQEIGRYVEIDGVPTLRLAIRKQSGANTVAVAAGIKAEVERINGLRGDMELLVITDQSRFIQESIDNVRNAAVWGGILAVIVLLAMLRSVSSTLIISFAIPISIVATFGLLYFGGLTLNQMTFGGLALGIGLIVDNAVVVLDNIVRKRQSGSNLKQSAEVGTREVSGAIVAATLTTSVIFLPVVFMRTTTGSMFQDLALVVVFALFCSLLVALTLVPMLGSRFLAVRPEDPDPEKRGRFQRRFALFEDIYTRWLDRAITHRWKVVGTTFVLFAASLLVLPTIPFELAPQTDGDEVRINMRMERGTNIAVMNEYLTVLDAIIQQTLDRDYVEYYTRDLREGRARIDLTLVEQSRRDRTADQIANQLRGELQNAVPGADVRVSAQSGLWIMRRVFSTGGGEEESAVEIQLRGHDLDTSRELAYRIRNRLERLTGVTDVDIGEEEGRPQQDIRIDRERTAELGLSLQDIAQTVQTNLGGRRAGELWVDGEERPIRVRLRPEDRLSTQDIGGMGLRTASGEVVPVSSVIRQQRTRGPISINRVSGQRVMYITANLEPGVALGDAVGRIQRDLSEMHFPEGYNVYFGGEYEEQQRAQADFALAILTALVLIYMVMAAQFERFLDPLVVLFSVPVALIGIVPTMLLTGTTINMQSLMGVLMLLGIVVNNAIVLVDYINLKRRDGTLSLHRSVIEAARLRLRPILITSMTTILAMVPLAMGMGTGAELQAALARVVIGGLAASTLITLFLIPIVYLGATRSALRFRAWLNSTMGQLRLRPAVE